MVASPCYVGVSRRTRSKLIAQRTTKNNKDQDDKE
jgi:hypothetical protein